MRQTFLCIYLFFSLGTFASSLPNELTLEFYIDSLIKANEVDYPIATTEFLSYSKKNYKNVHSVNEFIEYSASKMKDKEKEYTKNFTKELRELYGYAIVAHKHLHAFEQRVYKIITTNKPDKSEAFLNSLFIALHQINYWELNCYKPVELGGVLKALFQHTENSDLIEKIGLFILAAKIYKGSYYVNPMHICESTYAKTEIVMDVDSLNLKTDNITIDSIPTGTKPPVFIGGNNMMNHYIQSNIKYPEKALELGHEGRVLVSFKIDESGNLYSAKIKNSPSEFLSKEVLRIVESLPRWKPDPGTENGAGFTKFTMPFIFTLPEK